MNEYYVVEREGIVNFLSMYEEKKSVNWLGLWKDHYLGISQFQVIAYKVSKVIGFVRYKEFLKRELEKLKGFFRKTIGSQLSIRFVPEVRIHLDDSVEYGIKIASLLNEVKKKDSE